MKWWQVALIAYLFSAPVPALALEALGIKLYYEQLSFWLMGAYMSPMYFFSELLGGVPDFVIVIFYEIAVLLGTAVWLRRRSRVRSRQF